ncbi:MAG: polysaccharide biosynthesis protein [Bacteroides sp.]|nr:polysaccharide biosynthesis protein [Bacteroides sp.]
MIPKTIHYCWFSNDPMPAELKRCIASWKRNLPEYNIRKWDSRSLENIPTIPFVEEAVKAKKWAFACDYIRVYALYHEGGIYMDSDVYVRKSFDSLLDNRAFTAVECYPELMEKIYKEGKVDLEGNKVEGIEYINGIQIQAAILAAEKGHPFIKECMEYYHDKHFVLPDGTLDTKIISPFIFANIAIKYGFKFLDVEQNLKEGLRIYPSSLFAPNMNLIKDSNIAIHCCAGSWRWMPSDGVAYRIQLIKEIIKNILFKMGLRGNSIRKKVR